MAEGEMDKKDSNGFPDEKTNGATHDDLSKDVEKASGEESQMVYHKNESDCLKCVLVVVCCLLIIAVCFTVLYFTVLDLDKKEEADHLQHNGFDGNFTTPATMNTTVRRGLPEGVEPSDLLRGPSALSNWWETYNDITTTPAPTTTTLPTLPPDFKPADYLRNARPQRPSSNAEPSTTATTTTTTTAATTTPEVVRETLPPDFKPADFLRGGRLPRPRPQTPAPSSTTATTTAAPQTTATTPGNATNTDNKPESESDTATGGQAGSQDAPGSEANNGNDEENGNDETDTGNGDVETGDGVTGFLGGFRQGSYTTGAYYDGN